MGTQGSSSLAHLAADVEMYVPMTGSISGESDQRHALTDPSKVPRSFARFVAPSTITGLQDPSDLEGMRLYIPFDTDLYDHSIHEAIAAYSTTSNLKEVVDDRRWVVGGGSLRQERDYYARVFDAATVADITAFENSFSHLTFVLSCPVYSFDFTYYTEYRVLDLRCGQQPDSGSSGTVRLEIDIPGTFPVNWKGVIYAGGWSSSPNTVSVNAAGEVTNGMELWSRPVGQTEWTLLGARLSGEGQTGTRKFDYGITVSNALTVETEFKVKIKATSVGPGTNVRLSYLDVHSSNAVTHIGNIFHYGTPSKFSIAFWFVPQVPGGTTGSSVPFGYTAPSLNHVFGWQQILILPGLGNGLRISFTSYNVLKFEFGHGQTNAYWTHDIQMKVGEWQHFAATMDFDAREINCYINGTRSSRFGNALVYDETVIESGLYAGSWYSTTQLDEFYVFDRILSQEEVSHLASQWAPSTVAAIFTGAEYVDFGAPGNTPRCYVSTDPDCVVHTVPNTPSHSFHIWFKRSNAWETTATKNDVVFHISPYQNQENGELTLTFQDSGMVVEYRDCWKTLRRFGGVQFNEPYSWHQVVLTRTGGTGELGFYVDAVKFSISDYANHCGGSEPSYYVFVLGAEKTVNQDSFFNLFRGHMRDFMYFTKVIDADDVRRLYERWFDYYEFATPKERRFPQVTGQPLMNGEFVLDSSDVAALVNARPECVFFGCNDNLPSRYSRWHNKARYDDSGNFIPEPGIELGGFEGEWVSIRAPYRFKVASMVIEKSNTVNPPPGSWVLLARNLGGSWTTLYHQDVRIDNGNYDSGNWEDTTSLVDVSKQNFYDEYAMVILALQASERTDQLYVGMAPGVRRIYFTGVSIWDSATTDIPCECKAGYKEVTDSSGESSCSQCPAGTYQALTGQTSCDPCEAGTYQPDPGRPSCIPAAIGHKVGGGGATSQTACASGTYQNQEGQTSCTSCPGESFAAGTGNVRCLPWANCDHASLTNDVSPTATRDRTCKCNAGYSRSAGGSGLNGDAAENFLLIHNTPAYEYVLSAQKCTPCDSGKYQSLTGRTTCTACNAGAYQDSTGQTSCTPCEAGSYQSGGGRTSCNACPSEQYQPSKGQTSCIEWQECHSTTQVTDSDGSTTQDRTCKCKAGYSRATLAVSLSRSDTCTACNAGAYQNQEGQTSCKDCDNGFFAAGTGEVRCLPWANCDDATLTNDELPTATKDRTCKCKAGYSRLAKAEKLDGDAAQYFDAIHDILEEYSYVLRAQTCTPCDSGKYQSLTGKTTCTACNAGAYQDLTGQTSCTPCEAGSSQSEEGQTSCDACPSEQYQPSKGQTSCIEWQECDSTTQVTDFHGSTTQDRTCKCKAGYKEVTDSLGESSCSLCPAGTYQASEGQTSCTPCAAGTYQLDPGQTSCDLAEIGHKVSGEGATSQTACASGTYQNQKEQTSCKDCDNGFFAAGTGEVRCLPWASCSDASLTNHVSPTATRDRTCKCNAGYSRSGGGSGLNGEAVLSFPAIHDTEDYLYTLTAQTCTPCDSGKYQPSTGEDSCIPWQVCDDATQVTDFYGSTTRNRDCKCRAGYSRATLAVSLSRLDTCTACNAGAYQHSTGQTSCVPCAAGTYQLDTGQSSCDRAEIGHKVSAGGATSQTPCDPGEYQDQEGQSSCKLCADKDAFYNTWTFYAVGTGNIRCLVHSDCDHRSVTTDAAATNSSDRTCKCAEGYYRDEGGTSLQGYVNYAYGAIYSDDGSELLAPQGSHVHSYESCTAATTTGFWVDGEGATSQTAWQLCDATQVTDFAGSTTQDRTCKCQVGFSRTESATHLSNTEACAKCVAGSYQASTGQTSCDPCEAGSYQAGEAQTSCSPCAAGTYQGAEGAAACIETEKGYYQSSTGAQSPRPSGYGFFVATRASASRTICPAGTYCPGVVNEAATDCAVGTYQSETKQSSCVDAKPGHFVPEQRSLTQTPCDGQTFAAVAGSVRCLPHASCASDSTVDYTAGNATADATCQCAVGHWRATVDGGGVALSGYATQFFEATDYLPSFSYSLPRESCSRAAAGYYVDATGAWTATPCARGTYQPEEAQASCIETEKGYYQSSTGARSPRPSGYGFFVATRASASRTICPAGTYCPGVVNEAATDCAVGTYQPSTRQSSCLDADPGHFVPEQRSRTQTPCDGQTFAAVAGSVRCLPHATCTAAFTQADNVPTAVTDQTCECVEGYWRAGGGTGLSGSADETFAGTESLDAFRYLLRAETCAAAPAGSYVSAPGAGVATPCPEGQFQPEAGQPLCLHCEPGSYAPDAGHVRCSSCEPGKFQYLGGQPDCLYCRGYGEPGAPDENYSASYPDVSIAPNAVTYFAGSSQCYACPANAVAETESAHPADHLYPDKQGGFVGHSYCMCMRGAFADADTLNASRWAEMYTETADRMVGLRCHPCSYSSYQDTPGNRTTCTACPTRACISTRLDDTTTPASSRRDLEGAGEQT